MGIRSTIMGVLGMGDDGERESSIFDPGGPFSDPGGDMAANREAQERANEDDRREED